MHHRQVGQPFAQHAQEQVGLVVEVLVQGGLGQAGRGGDLARRGIGQAERVHDLLRRRRGWRRAS